MTRDVTVQFEDGSSHIYQGAPDDITPEAVTERAQKEFSKKVVHLDGGKKVPPAKPAKPVDDHSHEEYEDPLSAGLAKVGIDTKAVDKKLTQVENEPWYKQAGGVLESALSNVGGLASTAVGGVVGGAQTAGALAGGLAGGWNFERAMDEATKKGSDTISKVQAAGTYQPRTATGQALNETANYAAGIPSKLAGSAAGGLVDLYNANPDKSLYEKGSALPAKAKPGTERIGPKERAALESIGEAAPAIIGTIAGGKGALKALDEHQGLTRGEKMLVKEFKDFSPEEIKEAYKLADTAIQENIPLSMASAFPEGTGMHKLALKAANSNPVLQTFLKTQPEKVKAALGRKLSQIGEDVGVQGASDQLQTAATDTLSNASKVRTEEVKPSYDAAKEGDKQALQLMSDIEKQTKDINAGTKWKNDAVQQAGKWYKFTNDIGLKANELASKLKEWTGSPAEKQALADMEAEGGKPNPNVAKVETLLDRHKEGQAATQAAVDAAAERRAYLDQWQKEVNQKADTLAEHKLPEIKAAISQFASNIDEQLKLHTADHTPTGKIVTEEGAILKKFRDEVAPLNLPSQLESVRKTLNAKMNVGISSTPEDRAMAAVLHDHVENLTNLIDTVSEPIKQGRELYRQLSETYVDPLKKGPIGKLAGRGADAQKESSVGRMLSELQGKTADPKRVATIADELANTAKSFPDTPEGRLQAEQTRTAFPNAVRAWLEDKVSEATSVSTKDPKARSGGSKLADAIAGSDKEKSVLSMAIRKTAELQGATPAEARKAAIGASTFLQMLRATGLDKDAALQHVGDHQGLAAILAGGAVKPDSYGFIRAATDRIMGKWDEKAYAHVADMMVDPEAITKMVKLAGVKAANKAARQAAYNDLLLMAASPSMAPNQPTAENAKRKNRSKGTEDLNHVYISGLPEK